MHSDITKAVGMKTNKANPNALQEVPLRTPTIKSWFPKVLHETRPTGLFLQR